LRSGIGTNRIRKRKVRRTAGGVVLDADHRGLLIRRPSRNGLSSRGPWEVRLPKGKIERGETARVAALREVEEETGFASPAILADLGLFHSRYVRDGKYVTRLARYFLMTIDPANWVGQKLNMSSNERFFEPHWADDFDHAMSLLSIVDEQSVVERAVVHHAIERSQMDGWSPEI
jgi:8-oxo-dGTP pyrophosphatase MutT (NUDIX family)